MELLRTIAHPPGGGGAKCCEAAAGRAAGGESRRKKAEEQPHQHGHPAAEVSRIITDPTTGKRYCRGKVLGKVMVAASPPSSPPLSAECGAAGGRCPRGAAALQRESGARRAAARDLPSAARARRGGSERPHCPESRLRLGRARGNHLDIACGEWGARAFRRMMNPRPVLRKSPFAKEVALLD